MQIKAYRATTTQKHGGKVFLAGNIIPPEYIPPYSAQRLLSIGVITETVTDSGTENGGTFRFPLLTNNGVDYVDTTVEDLENALIILQKNADNAIDEINDMEVESINVLNILSKLDSRKSVESAVNKRLKALNGQGDE